jgi:uncharacterized protein (TIGR02231 family)
VGPMKLPIALLVLCLPFAAQAKVTSATLFPSHAQIVWEETASLEQGSGEITVRGLPVSMQDQTLMAELTGLAGVQIQRVGIRQVEQAEVVAESTRQLQLALEEVEQAIGAREDEIQAWNQQVTLMAKAAATPGEVTATELASLANTVQESTRKALSRIREIRQAMADDIAERDRIKRELAATAQNARATKNVTIVYQAPRAGQVTIELQYQTPDAGWHSQYNARLATEHSGTDGTLRLEHLASIRQATGTDWTDIRLSLSTANTNLGTDIPPLDPWVVSPGVNSLYRAKGAPASMDMVQSEAMSAPRTASVQNEGAFTQSYRLEAPVTLASGNQEQFVAVASYKMPVSVETRFFPAMDTNGFIHATGTYDGGVSLQSGPVTLYRDGQSVGRVFIETLSAGSELSMGFGVNDRVVAEVVNVQNQQGQRGIFNGKKYVRHINRYEITNNHPNTVAIRVFDRLPVSRQDSLTVEPLEITEPVTRNAQDIKGILAWERTIKPGETLTLQSGFELRVPEEAELPPEFQTGPTN